MEIDIKSSYDQRFNEIWNNVPKNFEYLSSRSFSSLEKLPAETILFVGLNPSFLTQKQKKVTGNYYTLSQVNNDYKKYFGVFEEISKKVGVAWSHIDLLYFRETKQEIVSKILKSTEGKDFIKEQLKISNEILEVAKPKVIVVCNTKARDLIGKFSESPETSLKYKFHFDENLGTDIITNGESKLKNVPVFFTSMLSGQRAIDKGSCERLIWHIKRVIKERNLNPVEALN